jgi:hypothetical protein
MITVRRVHIEKYTDHEMASVEENPPISTLETTLMLSNRTPHKGACTTADLFSRQGV